MNLGFAGAIRNRYLEFVDHADTNGIAKHVRAADEKSAAPFTFDATINRDFFLPANFPGPNNAGDQVTNHEKKEIL